MPVSVTAYRVLIASPSDLEEERGVMRAAMHAWNDQHAARYGLAFLPMMWEWNVRPQLAGAPQGIINRQLRDRDMVVAAFWTRIGSPTVTDLSGTVEEIRRCRAEGKDVMLYFSTKPADLSRLDTDQLTQLRAFRALVQREQGITGAFASPEDLRDNLTRHLTQLADELQARGSTPQGPVDAARATLHPPRATADVGSVAELLDPSLAHLLTPDRTPWTHIQQQIFDYRNVVNQKLPPYYMLALRPVEPIPPIPVADDERGDETFKRLCADLFGHSDAFRTSDDGIIFDPYDVAGASPDEVVPYACAFADGSIGVRDGMSFIAHWDEARPIPLRIDIAALWGILERAAQMAARWPRDVAGYTGRLEVRLSLGNMNDTVIVYPPDRLDTPAPRYRAPAWDAASFEWSTDRDINDLLEQHLASLARELQFAAYPSYKTAIRAAATTR